MKTIRVVAAVIKARNEKGEPIIFATQRGYGEIKDGWEFHLSMDCFWCEKVKGVRKLSFTYSLFFTMHN